MRKLIPILLLLLFSGAPAVSAQDENTRREDLLQLHYIPASFKSLAQLTWRYGLHPTSYDEAIDRYAKIINCPLYNTYYGNDFLWQRVREGLRREIDYYAPVFPDRFEMLGGVELGRYDFEKSAFIVPEYYSLTKAGYISISTEDAYNTPCDFPGYRTLFPPSMQLAADNPFSFTEIPVPPQEAKPLLERLSRYRYSNTDSSRMAMLRMRVRITGVKEYDNSTISPHIIFRGQLDEIAVFEDPAMTKPIWIKNFKELD